MARETLIFDKQIKTETRVEVPQSDRELANSGALTWMVIETPGAMMFCTGIDTKLVHGDRWQQIEGSFTENIQVDVLTMIFGNQTHTVMGNVVTTIFANETHVLMGNLTWVVMGNVTWTVLGNHIETHIGTTIRNYVAPLMEIHAAPKNIVEPTASIEVFGIKFQKKGSEFSHSDITISIGALNVSSTIAEFGLKGVAIALQGFSSTIGAIQGDLLGLDLNPGIEANGDSPFA